MFFVLSGFLITSLLLGEWARRLTVRLGQFWARRARRLLPALLLLLVGVAAYARFVAAPGEFAGLRLDSLSTLFYVANWHFIVGGSNYFAAAGPAVPAVPHVVAGDRGAVLPRVAARSCSVLLHLGRRLRPRRQLWPVLAAAVVGALASAADMRWSYLHGHRSPGCTRGPTPAARTSWSARRWPSAWPCGPSDRRPVPAPGPRPRRPRVPARPPVGGHGWARQRAAGPPP